MAETIMFPEIDEASLTPPAPPAATNAAALTVVTSTDPAKLDLTKLDLEAVALAHFEPARAALATATEKLAGVVHDLSTAGKLADAKSLRHRLINAPLAEARRVSVNLKSKLTATSKAVGAALVSIESDFKAAEALITPQIVARDAEIEAECQRIEEERKCQKAAEEAEAAARREGFEAALSKIRGQGTAARGLPSSRIAAGITDMEALAFGPEWAEYAPQAAQAQAETLVVLRTLHAETLAAEQAAAAAEALRMENGRKAAELAEQQRILAEQQRRMESIRRINAHCADAQAAIVGKAATDAVTTLETFVSATAGLDVSVEAFGDLAPMASMAQSMTLTQLRLMLAEAQARVQQEADEKTAREEQEAEDRRLSEANAALQVAAETAVAAANHDMVDDMADIAAPAPAVESVDFVSDGQPVRDWPDLQTAELACATTAQSPAIETESEHFSIKITEATPEQRAQRMSPRIDVTFSAEASAVLRSNCPRIDVVAADPEPALPALLAHIQTARASRFPSNPKVGPEFWVELYRLADEVQA